MARDALGVAREALGVAREALGVAREALGVAREALAVAWEALGVAREALGVAREALGGIREALGLPLAALRRARAAIGVPRDALATSGAAHDVGVEAVDDGRHIHLRRLRGHRRRAGIRVFSMTVRGRLVRVAGATLAHARTCACRQYLEVRSQPSPRSFVRTTSSADERQLLLQASDNYSCRSVAVLTARARLRLGAPGRPRGSRSPDGHGRAGQAFEEEDGRGKDDPRRCSGSRDERAERAHLEGGPFGGRSDMGAGPEVDGGVDDATRAGGSLLCGG